MKEFITCSEAYKGYLKELALENFPTGNGNWRNELDYRSDLLKPQHKEKDNPHLLTTESLLELNEKGPFSKEVKWSEDVKKLQLSSVKNPESVDKRSLHLYIKHLRLVDKNINTIDNCFQKFSNLSELILSANYIDRINSSLLPDKLKVLELCGNKIHDLNVLSVKPPPLQHLGLSYNLVRCPLELNPNLWNSLLSLDLSFNYLRDLDTVLTVLVQLPKLKSLLLQGNPVFLFQGYRGYTIDTITTLSILDDICITADERHNFKGFSKIKDLQTSTFQLFVDINNLKGITSNATEVIEDSYPRTVLKYHVEGDFITPYEMQDKASYIAQLEGNLNENVQAQDESVDENIYPLDTSKKTVSSNQIKTGEFLAPTPQPPPPPSQATTMEDDSYTTIPLNFSKVLQSTSIVEMHKLLRNCVELRVVENKIVVNNEPKPDDMMASISSTKDALKEPAKLSGRSKSKVSVTKKDEKQPSKGKPGGGIGGGGGKKHHEIELFEWSRTSRVIATTSIDLRQLLLEDNSLYANELTFQRCSEDVQPMKSGTDAVEDDNNTFNKKSETSKKTKQNNKETRRSSSKQTTRSQSRNKIKCDTSPPITTTTTTNGFDTGSDLPDLSVSMTIELTRWKSTKDGLSHLQHL